MLGLPVHLWVCRIRLVIISINGKVDQDHTGISDWNVDADVQVNALAQT